MAYGDYGAFVYKNSKRRTDKEDVSTFPKNTAVGFTNKEMGEYWAEWIVHDMHHGIIGDGTDYSHRQACEVLTVKFCS